MMIADEVKSFIDIAKEISKIPSLVLPQYKDCAIDFYCICKKILAANENISRWLNRISYFNFGMPDASIKFSDLVSEYMALRGSNFRDMKFSCHDIKNIYHRNIQSKIGKLVVDQHKLANAENALNRLSDIDRDIIVFVSDEVIHRLDYFVDKIMPAMISNPPNVDLAERQRMEFRRDTKNLNETLEDLNNSLTNLIMEFADIAKIPLTLDGVCQDAVQ